MADVYTNALDPTVDDTLNDIDADWDPRDYGDGAFNSLIVGVAANDYMHCGFDGVISGYLWTGAGAPTAEQEIQMALYVAQGDVGLVLRDNGTNAYFVLLSDDGSVRFIRFDAGAFTNLGTLTATFTPATFVTTIFAAVGTGATVNLYAKIGAAGTETVADSSGSRITSGAQGIYGFAGTTGTNVRYKTAVIRDAATISGGTPGHLPPSKAHQPFHQSMVAM